MDLQDFLTIYETTFLAVGAMAVLMFIQVLIADVVGLISGHTPGAGVEAARPRQFACAAEVVLDAVERVDEGFDFAVVEHVLDDDVTVDFEMQALGRGEGDREIHQGLDDSAAARGRRGGASVLTVRARGARVDA